MIEGIECVKFKYGPVASFSPDGVHLFDNDLRKVKNDIDYLMLAHSKFLVSYDASLNDVSFDDIEQIKQELTKIQQRYFENPV